MIDPILFQLSDYQLFCFFKSCHFLRVLKVLPQAAFIKAFDYFIALEISELKLYNKICNQNLLSEITTNKVDSYFCNFAFLWVCIGHLNI